MKKREEKKSERKDNVLMVDMHALAIAIVGPLYISCRLVAVEDSQPQ